MKPTIALLAAGALALAAHPSVAADPGLTAQTAIQVSTDKGHFDFIHFDADLHRVLACHPGSKQLAVLDVASGKVTNIDTGEVNGVAVDAPDNRYYTAGGNQDVVVIDRSSLQKVADIKATGPCDDVLYDPKAAMIYVAHDDGTEDWVVDPKTNTIVGNVTIAGAPEVMVYDTGSDQIFQNIKPTNQVQVINPATNAVVSTWSTEPAESPHGLAIDTKRGVLYSGGKNGTLAAIDTKTGKSAGSCDIANGVDELVFDSDRDRIYCACNNTISVVTPSSEGVTHIGDVPNPGSGHSVTLDPSTGSVWIAYTTDQGSYLEELKLSSAVASK